MPESVSESLPIPTTGNVAERIVPEERSQQQQQAQKRVKLVEEQLRQHNPRSITRNHGESLAVPNSRPGFYQWLRLYWLDNLTTAIVGALALVVSLNLNGSTSLKKHC